MADGKMQANTRLFLSSNPCPNDLVVRTDTGGGYVYGIHEPLSYHGPYSVILISVIHIQAMVKNFNR